MKESFAAKESSEAGAEGGARKNEMKNVQETIKQLHSNICLFSRPIESLASENENNLSKIRDSFPLSNNK